MPARQKLQRDNSCCSVAAQLYPHSGGYFARRSELKPSLVGQSYDGSCHVQESPHPRAPKSQKSLKTAFPGIPARSVKKVSKKSQNDPKTSQKDYKISVRGLFRHFFDTPGGEAREDRFETFLGFRARGLFP